MTTLRAGFEMTQSPPHEGVLLERIAASLAHAVAGPLSIITGRAELLARDAESPELAARAQQLLEPARQVMKILEATQNFGRSMREPAPRVALQSELAELAELAKRARLAGIEVVIDSMDHPDPVEVPSGRVTEIVSKLLAYLTGSAARGAIQVDVTRAEVVVELRPAAGFTLPRGRRELMDPWLVGPLEHAAARVELAIALGLAQESGGGHEQVGEGTPEARLVLHIPLRG